jgi:hypothetical protein
VIVAGFIGNEDQWRALAQQWPKGFDGSQRKSLHTSSLHFKNESERSLLKKLGAIPESAGVKRISGSVNEADYYDLVEGTAAELHAHGYALALVPLILAIENTIPPDESYKLVFEEQGALGFYREKALISISHILSNPPKDRRHIKRPKLIGWETMAKGQTCLCEPADYLCYHLAHKSADPNSVRTLWTAPIMGDGTIHIRHLTPKKTRELFVMSQFLRPQEKDELANFKRLLRSGKYDPWEELLEEKKARSE